tara:strand:- start:1811 stop:2089 length:279 start_codon:yes stop_codon:yes gene_type:complete
MSNVDITKIKLDLAVVAFLFIQLVGIVWWLSGLDSKVDNVVAITEELKGETSMAVLEVRISQLEATDKLLDEMIKELEEESSGTSFSLFGNK